MTDTDTLEQPAVELARPDTTETLGAPSLIVADRGHVWAARDVTFDDRWAHLKQARAVRRWGTTEGLNQLANQGPLATTRLDAAADLRVSLRALIAVIPCEADKWTA